MSGTRFTRNLRLVRDVAHFRLEDVLDQFQAGGAGAQMVKFTQVGPHFASESEAREWALATYVGQTAGDWESHDNGGSSLALKPGDGIPPVEAAFAALLAEWNEVEFALSAEQLIEHPAYQRIVGLGPPALPLTLLELRDRPAFWLWALRAIAGTDVAEDATSFEAARQRWLEWGAKKHLI